MLAVSLIATAALAGGVMPWRRRLQAWYENLPDRLGESRLPIQVGGIAAASIIGLSLSYFVLGGRVVGSNPPGGGGGSFEGVYTPIVDVAVVDTSTWWAQLNAFSSTFGGDSQDSLHFQVDRVGGNFSSPLTDVRSASTFLRDTLTDNVDWKADTTYVLRGRRHGVLGGWSAYDSITLVNNQGIPDSVYIHLDWDGSVGTSKALIMDSSKAIALPNLYGMATVNSDVCPSFTTVNTAGAGRDYPTTNFLRMKTLVNCGGVTDGTNFSLMDFRAASNFIPSLAVGDSVFVRYYNRANYPYSDKLVHGTEWSEYPFPYSFDQEFSSDNTSWQPQLQSLGGRNYCVGGYQEYLLSTTTTYRIEHGVIRTATNSFEARARIYSVSGTLLYDSNNFTDACWDNAGGNLSTMTFTGNSTYWDTYARQFEIGDNGNGGITEANDEVNVFEWAAFVICSSWCGPWPIAGVEN